jgi:hypothetical protein
MSRIVNPKFYKEVRERDGSCLWGLRVQDGCSGPLEVHHLIKRSHIGNDILKNGILLCHRHHDQAEGYIIKANQLVALLVEYYHYEYTIEERRELEYLNGS